MKEEMCLIYSSCLIIYLDTCQHCRLRVKEVEEQVFYNAWAVFFQHLFGADAVWQVCNTDRTLA